MVPKERVHAPSGEDTSGAAIPDGLTLNISIDCDVITKDNIFNVTRDFKEKLSEFPVSIIVNIFNHDIGVHIVDRIIDDGFETS